jgi:2,4-dienoyl-CoA reductase-like NADH-dependent reductase (Old Yellow Enzyme family)
LSDLLDPVPLPCGLTLANRAGLAPLTNTQSHPDGTLGDDELRWLVARARHGWGYLSTCAAYVSEEGHAWRGQLGVATDAHLPGLTRLAAALRAEGAQPIVQLHHGGKVAEQAPGEKLYTTDGDGVRGATAADLARVIDDFVAAAQRCAAAGFSGVELHGANGYLFTQFLAPADNPRTDAWGGDLAGRAKLLRDALRAVREAVPAGFAVGVRLSPADTWSRRGLVLADGVQVARWLAEDGADWIHLSLRDATAPPPFEEGAPVVARAVRDAVPAHVPLLAAGGIRTAADVARARAAGIDVTVVGKAAIRHADWPARVLDPAWAPEPMPWTEEALTAEAVGAAFLAYLKPYAGMVVGGREAR